MARARQQADQVGHDESHEADDPRDRHGCGGREGRGGQHEVRDTADLDTAGAGQVLAQVQHVELAAAGDDDGRAQENGAGGKCDVGHRAAGQVSVEPEDGGSGGVAVRGVRDDGGDDRAAERVEGDAHEEEGRG